MLDVGLSRKRRIHDHAVHQRRGCIVKRVALTDAMPLVTQRLRVCWHPARYKSLHHQPCGRRWRCPCPALGSSTSMPGRTSATHQAVNDIWRCREQLNSSFGMTMSPSAGSAHPCRCVISENMRLCPAVPRHRLPQTPCLSRSYGGQVDRPALAPIAVCRGPAENRKFRYQLASFISLRQR